MSFYANDEKKKKMITVKTSTHQLLKNTYPLHYCDSCDSSLVSLEVFPQHKFC